MSQRQLEGPPRFRNIAAQLLESERFIFLFRAGFDYESEGKLSFSAGFDYESEGKCSFSRCFYYESGGKMASHFYAPASRFFFYYESPARNARAG